MYASQVPSPACAAALRAARAALEGLDVRPDAMARVLDVTGGLIVSESVMMGLAPRLGRQVAHDIVYDCCRKSLTEGVTFLDALAGTPDIAAGFSRDELVELIDPANYLGAAPAMTRRLLAQRK